MATKKTASKPVVSAHTDSPPTSEAKRDARTTTIDSLQNLLTGMGSDRDKRQFTTVARRNEQAVSDLDTLFVQDDLTHNLVAIPAEDMTREWVDLQGKGELPAKIEDDLAAINAQGAFLEALMWSRLHGGSIIVVGLDKQPTRVDEDDGVVVDLSKPAIPGRPMWLQVYDKEEVSVVNLDDTGAIESYDVVVAHGENGSTDEVERIHASRVLRFDAEPMPRRMRETGGWGMSVVARAEEPIRDLNTAMAGVAVAMNEFSQSVLLIDGLTDMLAADRSSAVKDRLTLLNLMRSMFGLMTLDAKDKFEEVARDFSSVPDILDRLSERVASAGRMPVSLLLGRSPAGLNATGDADIRWWYAHIAAQQQVKVKPPLLRLIAMMRAGYGAGAASAGEGEDDDVITVNFRPLWMPTEKEQAETHLTQAQADKIYLEAGVVDEDEVALSRFSATGYSVDTVIDIIARLPPALGGDNADDEGDGSDDELDPAAEATSAPPTGATDVQKTALNGAQVAAMKDIVIAVVKKEIPRDAGIAMLEVSFQLSNAEALKIMGSAGSGFEAAPPAPTPLFGGAPTTPVPPAPVEPNEP